MLVPLLNNYSAPIEKNDKQCSVSSYENWLPYLNGALIVLCECHSVVVGVVVCQGSTI